MRLRCAWDRRFALLFLLIFAPSTLAAEPKFPTLTGRVVDDAGVLSAATQSRLTDMLAAHERATGQQVVVVTLDSLQGFTIEDYGYQLGRHWGIGQKGTNTGALLIVAPKEHKVRIEVGYGLEGTLTDAQSRIIIEQSILPSFRSGDFNAGILNGTQAIIQVLGGNPLTAAPRPQPATPWGFLIVWCLFFFGPWVIFIFNWLRHHNDPVWQAQHRIALVQSARRRRMVRRIFELGQEAAAAVDSPAAVDRSAAAAHPGVGDDGNSVHARKARTAHSLGVDGAHLLADLRVVDSCRRAKFSKAHRPGRR